VRLERKEFRVIDFHAYSLVLSHESAPSGRGGNGKAVSALEEALHALDQRWVIVERRRPIGRRRRVRLAGARRACSLVGKGRSLPWSG
jgi:hypothetical protein